MISSFLLLLPEHAHTTSHYVLTCSFYKYPNELSLQQCYIVFCILFEPIFHIHLLCVAVSPFCTGKKCILRERPGQKEKLILRERAATLGETLYYLFLTFTAMGIRKKIWQFYFYFCHPKGQIHQHYNSKNF